MLVKFTRQFLSAQTKNIKISQNKEIHLISYLRNNSETNIETETKQQQQQQQQQQKQNEAPSVENELKSVQEKLAKCEEERIDLKDKYLRAMAEAENVRVRMRKQVDDAKLFGIQGFCKDLLEVADILNLAIKNTDPNKNSNESNQQLDAAQVKEKLNSMHQGLVMTEGRLLKIFEKHGLVRINPNEGEKFDPNLHEAIFRVPIPNKQSGTIEVVSKIGFKLQERVIRAAQVGVVQ